VSEQVRQLREALRAQPAEDEEAEGDLEIEKMGDTAFDWITSQVRQGHLKPAESVRGLRLLSRLTRQFCLHRKGELLDTTLELAVNRAADRDVRSTATHIAATNVAIARGLADPASAYRRSVREVQDEVAVAVRRAIDLGLAPEVEAFAKAFLAIHKKML